MELLAAAFATLPYVAVAVLALLAAFIAVAVVGRPGVGCFLFGLLYVQNTLLPNMGGLPVGVTLYLGDLVCPLLGVAGAIRLASRRQTLAMPWTFWLLGAVLVVSFVSGLAKFGSIAGVAFRPYFYALSIALYFASVPFDDRMMRLFIRTQVMLAAFLIVVTILRWTGALPSGSAFEDSSDQFALLDRIRVITAVQALLPLQLALILVMGREKGAHSGGAVLASLLLAGFVLVLQHRSVWLAGLAAVAATPLLRGSLKVRTALWAGLGLVAIVTLLIAMDAGGPVLSEIARSADRAMQGADTAKGRFENWSFVVNKWWAGGPQAWLLGLPFGTDLERYVISSTGGLEKADYQAHNFYVQTLFNSGLLGVAAFAAFSLRILLALRTRSLTSADGATPGVFFVLFVSQLTFYLTYGISFEHGMLLGACMSLAFCATASNEPVENLAQARVTGERYSQ